MVIKIRDVEVRKLIGESSRFRIYLGNLTDGQETIVKVAKTFEDNVVLAEDAKEFNMLKLFEKDLKKFSADSHVDAKYDLLFARLHSSFIAESQQDRRINVFTVPEVNLADTIPLSKLSSQVEIDARTSVWILGRLFKFYIMFELKRIADEDDACHYPIFSEHDYFISPEKHRVVYSNFSGEIHDVYATDFIKIISRYIFDWTVFDDSEENIRYKTLLQDFIANGRETAAEAHQELYDLIREIWGICYYPFTYRHRGTLIWKTIKEE